MSRAPGLMVVVAHPDDESFGVGGSMAVARARGSRVDVLIATSGQAGEIVLPDLDTAANRADLGALREAEARAAAAALDVRRVEFLGYQDGSLADVPERALALEVAAGLRVARPDVLVTFGPDGIYGHPDHLAIHRAATLAFDLAADPAVAIDGLPPFAVTRLFYNVIPEALAATLNQDMGPIEIDGRPLSFFGYGEAEIRTRVDISAVFERKLAALAAHASQTGGDVEAIRERLGERVGKEHFLLARDRGPDVAGLGEDLMAGLS